MAAQVLIEHIFMCTTAVAAIKSSGAERKRWFVATLGIWAYSIFNVKHSLINGNYAAICAFAMLWGMEHLVNIIFIAKYELTEKSWRSGYYMLFNGRWVGTRYSVIRRQETGSGADELKETHVKPVIESRGRFAARILGTLLLKYFFMVLYHDLIDMPALLDLTKADFTPEKTSFVRRVMLQDPEMNVSRESIIRMWGVFSWLLEDYITYSGLHELCALVFVSILGLHNPQDWPSLYGSIHEVTNLASWYSKFWHLLFYRNAVAYTRVIMEDVFKIDPKKRTKGTKFLLVFLVFAVSASNHLIVEWMVYKRWNWSNFMWYIAQPALIAVEDGVQMIARLHFPWIMTDRFSQLRKWSGRIWVFAIFFWGILRFQIFI